MDESGSFYLRRIKELIMELIEKDYEEMGMTITDLKFSDMNKQDNLWYERRKIGGKIWVLNDKSWQKEFLNMKSHSSSDAKLIMGGVKGIQDSWRLGVLHVEYEILKKI